MSEPIWIEVLSRHGDVAARFRLAGGEGRIGRAYDNDVVVDDPYVAPRHIRVFRDAEGHLVAEDLGSATGLRLDGGHEQQQRLLVDGNRPIRIGRTLIRVRTADHPVPPEREEAHGLPLAAIAVALAIVAVFTGIQELMIWLAQITEPKLADYVSPPATTLGILAIWVGLWTILNRIFAGHSQFERHLFIALFAMLGMIVYGMFAQFAGFALKLNAAKTYFYAVQWAILALAALLHLRVLSPARLALKGGIVAGVLVVAIAVQALDAAKISYEFGSAHYVRLLPPWMRLAPVSSEDRLFADIGKLRSKIDRDRKKLIESDTRR